ncbi:unnamed protein product [Staurois parvus]|uniref:Uncharacterized protein n=1 Tax=Staurois parvus TaxID=386267 RepID=A0ABN9CE76_9NEOB|nr:unnamed protein product [Staurois parvus]CAI9557536.1 unnamed protein product [Staurois parvus]CAI9562272.1 unnamed protein product [Staurois parvus]CAI9564374.1 unnamed protein product [Staurois parvus]CAI9588144.1 unnamed protein product [Staurois parvus]
MTRDCGQSTGDDQETADLWGGRGSGYLNLTGTRSHFRGVAFPLLPGPASVTAGCPLRRCKKRFAL